jgi:hypothetical protein
LVVNIDSSATVASRRTIGYECPFFFDRECTFMGKYTLKILLDIDAPDDLEGRRRAASLVQGVSNNLEGVREIVLHAVADRKSIKMNPDGSFQGQWNRGGAPSPPETPG